VSYLGAGRYHLLNEEREVPDDVLPERHHELLWDYTLHYFDGLLAPEPARREKAEWIMKWIRHVPPGARPAWDPYPLSRRILSWVKWDLSSENDAPPAFEASLAAQARYLTRTLEYDLLGNHLLANATALVAAGSYFRGPEAESWLRLGMAIFQEELTEQFLDDGAHFELSPAYHALVLEDLLDLVQILRSARQPVPPQITSVVRAASRWLAAMVLPSGQIPLFNDASYDMASAPPALATYADALGLAHRVEPQNGIAFMEDSGYFRYDGGRLTVIGDVGQVGPSYQPGHVHCDMLSFVLEWEGRPWIVDTGTSTYERGARRSTERGTAAHNNVSIPGVEQSEVWAAFRVGQRARVEHVTTAEGSVSARIVAFPTLWLRHERKWSFHGERTEIIDSVQGKLDGRIPVARFHFHPDVELVEVDGGWKGDGLRLEFDGARAVRVEPYDFAPEFNLRFRGSCLCVEFEGLLRTRVFE
jgi:uncharacterized heparinase superfamily protein